MKKPMYDVGEIHDLLSEIEKDTNSSPSGAFSVTKDALNSFILFDGKVDDKPYNAFQEIAAEAYNLEQDAKELRRIVRTFKCPMTKVPKLINDENSIIANIARWRLNLGR